MIPGCRISSSPAPTNTPSHTDCGPLPRESASAAIAAAVVVIWLLALGARRSVGTRIPGRWFDLAQVALTAANREQRRAEISFEQHVIPEIELEKADDDLASAELSYAHAVQDMELDRERLAFELRTMQLDDDRQRLLVEDLKRQVDELTIRVGEQSEQVMTLRLKLRSRKLDNPLSYRVARRELARMKTVLNDKRRAAAQGEE